MKNYFPDDELKCQHCGMLVFNAGFRNLLNSIRADVGFPMIISSGYRCPEHPIEKAKLIPGEHADGEAVDVAVSYAQALKVLRSALAHGIERVGISQQGDGSGRFIHLGYSKTLPTPALWSY